MNSGNKDMTFTYLHSVALRGVECRGKKRISYGQTQKFGIRACCNCFYYADLPLDCTVMEMRIIQGIVA